MTKKMDIPEELVGVEEIPVELEEPITEPHEDDSTPDPSEEAPLLLRRDVKRLDLPPDPSHAELADRIERRLRV